MDLFTYKVERETSLAVRHICLQCDQPVLIDTSGLHSGNVYFCTYCGLDWRMPSKMADDVALQIAVLSRQRDIVPAGQ